MRRAARPRALLGVAGLLLTLSEVSRWPWTSATTAGRCEALGKLREPTATLGRLSLARGQGALVVQRVRHRRVRARHVEARVFRHLSPRAH
ncbi:MAG: hypothetical protein IPG81_25370 [Sandaracinaceae bacterium]|nr:hypothetical protein [Sandaracinaceae bacterium]